MCCDEKKLVISLDENYHWSTQYFFPEFSRAKALVTQVLLEIKSNMFRLRIPSRVK